MSKSSAVASFLVTLMCATSSLAQMAGAPAAGYKRDPGIPSANVPAPLREIGFDQNIGERLPLDVPVRDEAGQVRPIGAYFGSRPVVLLFAYYDCPQLCTMSINGLASALGVLSLVPGRDFELVTVSFDPRDTPASAAAKKATYLERYQRPGARDAWHFLTADQPSIDRLTTAAGFRYVWDDQTKQFAHPTGIIVVTPDGRFARYLFGIEYGPRDLRLGIIEASAGRVGNVVDAFLLYCYHYDPMTGRYGLAIMRAIRVAGAATVFGLVAFIAVMIRSERRKARRAR